MGEYSLAMGGDRLFLDSGTGPERGLVVYDVLLGRRKLGAVGGYELAGWRDRVTLTLSASGSFVPRRRCPSVRDAWEIPESVPTGVSGSAALDLRSFRLTPVGPARCSARQ